MYINVLNSELYMAFSRIMLIAEAIARYNRLYISTSGGFKKAIAQL